MVAKAAVGCVGNSTGSPADDLVEAAVDDDNGDDDEAAAVLVVSDSAADASPQIVTKSLVN